MLRVGELPRVLGLLAVQLSLDRRHLRFQMPRPWALPSTTTQASESLLMEEYTGLCSSTQRIILGSGLNLNLSRGNSIIISGYWRHIWVGSSLN